MSTDAVIACALKWSGVPLSAHSIVSNRISEMSVSSLSMGAKIGKKKKVFPKGKKAHSRRVSGSFYVFQCSFQHVQDSFFIVQRNHVILPDL